MPNFPVLTVSTKSHIGRPTVCFHILLPVLVFSIFSHFWCCYWFRDFVLFQLLGNAFIVMGFAGTIPLNVGRKLNGQSQAEKSKAITDHFAPLKIESVQFCFELVHVTFKTEKMKGRALQKGFPHFWHVD